MVISQWKTDRLEITPKWVGSDWLNTINGLPKIKSTRTIKGRVEWEFSDKTKHGWSVIFVALLSAVDKAIEGLKRTEIKRKDVRREMETLNTWCRMLYYFVSWEAGIVSELLTKTNMVDGITDTFMPMRTDSGRCLINALDRSLSYDS